MDIQTDAASIVRYFHYDHKIVAKSILNIFKRHMKATPPSSLLHQLAADLELVRQDVVPLLQYAVVDRGLAMEPHVYLSWLQTAPMESAAPVLLQCLPSIFQNRLDHDESTEIVRTGVRQCFRQGRVALGLALSNAAMSYYEEHSEKDSDIGLTWVTSALEAIRTDVTATDVATADESAIVALYLHPRVSTEIPSVLVDKSDLLRCHDADYLSQLDDVCQLPHHHLTPDTYCCSDTGVAAHMSAGIVLSLVDKVVHGVARNGFAIVRPPGHHAEPTHAMGFCMFNNVAVAAAAAVAKFGLKRVLILDWDIHHGNGTEHMFEADPTVLYCSLHRYDDQGAFYPGTGAPDSVGSGAGTGFNVNVGWPGGGVGDAEYLAAFDSLLMPIFRAYAPELVLVSAGFDSALGDPLGRCRLTPPGYAHLTHMLSSLAEGKIVLALE
ncbi:hypothetical protein DYB31_015341, partial [Aphanomyces astaci]